MISLEIRIDQNKLCHTKLKSSGTAFVRQIKVRREESEEGLNQIITLKARRKQCVAWTCMASSFQ